MPQHFRQANGHPWVIDVKLHEQDAIGIQVPAGFAERLFRVYKIIDPHIRIIGKLSMRVQQPKQNQVIALRSVLEERPRVSHMNRDPGRIVRTLRMLAFTQIEDGRINLDRTN